MLINQCVSSAYHSQTNRLDEHFNQMLINTLKKVIDPSKEDWDEHIPAALKQYDTKHDTLRWDGSHSAEVNENINRGYSHDQCYS